MSQGFPNRRGFLRDLATAAATQSLGGAAQSGNAVQCRIVDARGGEPLAARVRLTDSKGNEVVPVGRSPRLSEEGQEGDVRFQSRRYSYVDGAFQIDPASLPLRYQVLRGYEYVIAERELTTA